MSTNNEYMRKYMLSRYHRRRDYWIERLGGKCKICNSTTNLEFDHINRIYKEFNVAKALAGFSDERLESEMSKCQILCKKHHLEKTRRYGDHGKNKVEHGTYWMYRKYKCRCEACKIANSKQIKEWKSKR